MPKLSLKLDLSLSKEDAWKTILMRNFNISENDAINSVDKLNKIEDILKYMNNVDILKIYELIDDRINKSIDIEYKKIEDDLFNTPEILNYLQKCEECGEPIDKFSDLKKIPTEIMEKYSYFLQTSIKKRRECNEIYKSYIHTNSSIERHQYVIDMLSSI